MENYSAELPRYKTEKHQKVVCEMGSEQLTILYYLQLWLVSYADILMHGRFNPGQAGPFSR